jgi:hypothetical protein
MRRVLEYDAERGLRIDYHGNGDGTFSLSYHQDVEPLLDCNKAKQSAGRDYYASDPDMWKVASVPVTIQYEWIRRYGVDPLKPEHQDLLARLLNDPEWRYLRTSEIVI